jgi:hypothetical protein
MLFYSDSGINFLTYKLGVPCTVTGNLDEYINSKESKKIAVLFDNFDNKHHSPEAVGCASTLVVNYETEFHSMYSKHYDGNNLYWALPGIVNVPTIFNNNCFTGGWLETTANYYRNQLAFLLQDIDPLQTKTLAFDCLLGAQRDHRTFVYDNIINNNLSKYFYLTYYKEGITNSNFYIEPGTIVPNDVRWSNCRVEYMGVDILLSQIIPLSIYKETAYSIVAETNVDNDFSFFTEKVAKPILAKRLFVVFATYNYLKNLRSLGFQTFGSVIDESYDSIQDDTQRFIQAFSQVEKLCLMDQAEVLAKIQPIVEHNRNVLMNCSWKSAADDWLVSVIKEKAQIS